ncbi:MAG: pilus assembly protein PilM [Candidatus Omnitrophica bacterium]|nr:pilus assembly protein PilM [Candidatus Omnitrophota bacterium]
MKKVVGIDLGHYNIKLVELEHKKGRPVVSKCLIAPAANGNPGSALKTLLGQAKLSLKRVNVSLAGPSVIVRYIEMPPMKKEEIESAIKFEAEKYIPFDIDQSIIDCAMLDKTSSGSQRVLLVAAKKAEVSRLTELFKNFGLEIGAIDVDNFAFLNCFHAASEKKEDIAYGLINMGDRFSNMNIVTKGDVYFTRDILWGGADITKRIRDAMGVSLEDAEALKKNPAEKREEIISVINPMLERLTSQMRMSFDYFESQFGRGVEKVYISGGTSYLFNMLDFLKDNLGLPVMMWDPFEAVSLAGPISEPEGSPALFAVAIGLALRS